MPEVEAAGQVRPAALSPPGAAAVPALELAQVTLSFGALKALDRVSLRVAPGERRAVLGSNGAGKTTLFNVITGEFPQTSGGIKLFGQSLSKLSVPQRIRLGLRRSYQISQIFGGLTVLHSLYLARVGVGSGHFSLRRPSRADSDLAAAQALAASVGLQAQIDTRVSDLSYGQQRELEIGMALAGEPRLLLLDEPAAGLSPLERGHLVVTLNRLPPQIGFIIIEHDLSVALRVASSVTMMHNGRVFKEGSPEEIENDPEVQALYLGVEHA